MKQYFIWFNLFLATASIISTICINQTYIRDWGRVWILEFSRDNSFESLENPSHYSQ